MTMIPGCGNWRIRYTIIEDKEQGNAGIRILRAVTCDRNAELPEELPIGGASARGESAYKALSGAGNAPVVSIAGHALSADRWDADEGPGIFDLEMTDGRGTPQEEQWGNRGMETLRLPDGIRAVGDYAFLNCRNMRRIELADRKIEWQRACFMNCRALREIVLRRDKMEDDGTNTAYFVGDTTGELEITIRSGADSVGNAGGVVGADSAGNAGGVVGADSANAPCESGGEEARLVFPDYLELYTENNEARQFDYTIEGAGYPYRHVFRNKQLSWHDYDSLWKDYLGRETDRIRAARMAWGRVSRPVGLSPEHRKDYMKYVAEHFLELAEHVMCGSGLNPVGVELAQLVQIAAPDQEKLAEAAALARSLGRTDCLAVLMEQEHQKAEAPVGRRKTYEL